MATRTIKPTKAQKAVQVAKVVGALQGHTPIGVMIDEMHLLREKKRKLAEQVTELEQQYTVLETDLMARMEAEQTDKGAGKLASASISTGVVADVEDWGKLEAFVKRTGHFQLFQRRISDPAFRELMESKGSVPGIKPFTKKRLNLRSST